MEINAALNSARAAYRGLGSEQSEERTATLASIAALEKKQAATKSLISRVNEGGPAYAKLRARLAEITPALAAARQGLASLESAQEKQRQEVALNIASLENERRQLQGLAADSLKAGGSVSQGSGSAGRALSSLTQGFKDVGAAGGNVSTMVQNAGGNFVEFGRHIASVAKQARSTGSTLLSTLGAAVMGPAGIVAGISIAISLIPTFISWIKRSGDANSEAAGKVREHKAEVYALVDAMRQTQGVAALAEVRAARDSVSATNSRIQALARLQQAYRDAAAAERRQAIGGRVGSTRTIEGRLNLSDALRAALVNTGAMEQAEVDALAATASRVEATREIAKLQGEITGLAQLNRVQSAGIAETEERIGDRLDVQLERVRERIALERGNPGRDPARLQALVDREKDLTDAMRSRSEVAEEAAAAAHRNAKAQGKTDREAQQAANAAARSAERAFADEEAVVTARRNMAEGSAQHAIEMEREALEASRAGVAARLALIADEGQRATARYVADLQYADAREALAEREVASRLEAARAAADGEQAAAEARARQTYARSEKTAADSKELRASTEAAQAVGDQKRLEADEAAALARARIHTEAVQAEMDRERDLTTFHGEQAAQRAEMIREITQAPAPDVGATLSTRVTDELAADIERARLRMERGIIDPEAFRQEVSALREHARGEIEKIADDMAKLGPIGAVAAAAILAAFDQTKGAGFDKALDDLAEMTLLADEISAAFAALGSDVLADLSGSIGDVTSALARAREVSQKKKDKVQGFTGLAGSLASLGSAAGVITAAVGAMGALKGAIFGAAEENRRNAEALADARRATEANTRALLSGQVGSDVSRDQLDAFEGGRDAVREAVEGIFDGRFFDTGLSEANEALGAFLRSLEDAGLDVSEFQSRFDAARDLTAGARRDAFASILDDMERRFGQIGASLGDYSADFAGAVAQLEDDLRQLGLSGADALDAFVAKLREADLGPVVDGFLDTMAALEPGTDEYEAALRAFYKSVREGGVSLPSSMSMDDLEALLDSFRGIRGEGGASASDVDRTNATSTAQATFAQQDATNGYLQGLWRTVREWFAAWKGEGPSGVAGAPLAGSLPLPTAPPLAAPSVPDFAAAIDAQRAQNHADLRAIYGVLAAVSAPAPGASRDDLARLRQPDGARVTVGPVTVSGVGDAEAIARQAGDEVYRRIVRELRAPQVVRGRTQ